MFTENLALQEKEFTEGPDYHFMSHEERYINCLRKAVHAVRCNDKYDLDNMADIYWFEL